MQLVWLRDLTFNFVSVDRGHKHSNGTSEVQIWLSEHAHNEASDTGQDEGPSHPTYIESGNTDELSSVSLLAPTFPPA